jgi:hypothetical protein
METIADLLLSVRPAKIAAAVTLAFLSVALAYAEAISGAALGPDWHCTRTAFIWTSCSAARLAEPDAKRATKQSF